MLVFTVQTGTPAALDAADPEPGCDCFGGIGTNFEQLVEACAPGATSLTSPPGMGIPLQQGADIVVQIHYPEGSGGQLDSTRLNYVLYSESLFNDDC